MRLLFRSFNMLRLIRLDLTSSWRATTPRAFATVHNVQMLGRRVPAARFSVASRVCDGKKDTTSLFAAISDLSKIGIVPKSFPVITVVGPQSSGKTSVIEAICGKSIFPTGMGVSTLKPFHITVLRSDRSAIVVGDKEFASEKEAQDEIERVNHNDLVPSIEVTIKDPGAHNAHLVDLPGLIAVASNDPELPKKIKTVNTGYIQNPNTIPVIIHAAPSDPATNHAIQLVQRAGRLQDAFGVVTKVDMIEGQKSTLVSDILSGKAHPLGSDTDIIDKGMSIDEKTTDEEAFAARHSHLRPFGSRQMKQLLSDIQFERIRSHIPELIASIDAEIKQCLSSESFLETLLTNSNSKITAQLRSMIEKLVGSSPERVDFENELKKEFEKLIGGYLGETFRRDNVDEYRPRFASTPADTSIVSFHSRHHSNPSLYAVDEFKEIFSTGLLAPTSLDSNHVQRATQNESLLACTTPLFHIVTDDAKGLKRMRWMNHLKVHLNRLVDQDHIQATIQRVTVAKLLEYVRNDLENHDEATRKFAEYMIREIGNEAFNDKVRYCIQAVINLERRPLVTLHGLVRHLTQIYKEQFTFHGGFFAGFTKKTKLLVETYSEPWNEAYLRAVSDGLIENCYRNVAVNLIDIMVQRILEKTIDLVNKEHAKKEKAKVSDKLTKLNELKRIISQFVDT